MRSQKGLVRAGEIVDVLSIVQISLYMYDLSLLLKYRFRLQLDCQQYESFFRVREFRVPYEKWEVVEDPSSRFLLLGSRKVCPLLTAVFCIHFWSWYSLRVTSLPA